VWWTLATDYCLIKKTSSKPTNQIAAWNIVVSRASPLLVSRIPISAFVVTQPRQCQALLQQENVIINAQEIKTRSVEEVGE